MKDDLLTNFKSRCSLQPPVVDISLERLDSCFWRRVLLPGGLVQCCHIQVPLHVVLVMIPPERTLNQPPCLVSDIVWIRLGNLSDRQHCHNLCRRPARDPRQNIYVQTFPIALFIFFKIYEREYYLQQEWILSEEAGFCILNLLLPIPIGEYFTPSRMVSTDYWQI